MTSHDLELPLDLYQHNLVQIKADLILLMGGLTGSSLTVNTNYNIYVLGPSNCECRTCPLFLFFPFYLAYSTHLWKSSLPTGPTTASWPSWLRYRSKYCDSNNGGGDIIQPDSTTPISLSQCQQACEANSLCEGIVLRGFPTTQAHEAAFVGYCMKIANLKLSECSASLETDVLFARSGGKAWRLPRGNRPI